MLKITNVKVLYFKNNFFLKDNDFSSSLHRVIKTLI